MAFAPEELARKFQAERGGTTHHFSQIPEGQAGMGNYFLGGKFNFNGPVDPSNVLP